MDLHERISINPKVCHGEPCVKGTRIMVTNILAAIAEGLPMSEILQDFPGITTEDVLACVAFAFFRRRKPLSQSELEEAHAFIDRYEQRLNEQAHVAL
ncbi:DUF433 domain-containing protein [candidate division KSB1 bacterium]|nr:DUF433 domain-containing protein [candidate division KSB1 bacterium]